MKTLPTRQKEKLPRGFSYPVGAEFLSKSLRGVPQYDVLSIWFCWKDTLFASEYRAKVDVDGPIEVIDAHRYLNYKFEPEWVITLHAVPSGHSQDARSGIAQVLSELASELHRADIAAERFHWVATYDLRTRVVAHVA